MKKIILVLAMFCTAEFAQAQSDSTIAGTQQALKEQGFYYGEVTGKKDADTIAALRRYQIRSGLQVTGELNAETQKSLGVKGALPPPAASAAPPARETAPQPPINPDVRDEAPPRRVPTSDEHSAGSAATDVFTGTPFQSAPPETQRRVIMNAQNLLARRGYLRSAIDGEFGADTEFALRAFQARFNIPSSGRLDRETLAAMGLMPGQRTPGVTAGVTVPHERVYRPAVPRRTTPEGEPIYEGR